VFKGGGQRRGVGVVAVVVVVVLEGVHMCCHITATHSFPRTLPPRLPHMGVGLPDVSMLEEAKVACGLAGERGGA
jgi:hypothetical protein